MHGIVMRFGEHEGGVTGVNRAIERPIDRETAVARLADGKPVVMGIKSGDDEECFVLRDPAIGYVYAEVWGHPDHPGSSAHLRFAMAGPGSVALVSAHFPMDIFEPDRDDFRWSQSVFLRPAEDRRAILQVRSHGMWLVESLVDDLAAASLAAMRFPLATLEDHARLVTPEMAGLALRDPDVFDPERPDVRMIVPDEDLEEADRLMEEPDVVAV